MRRLFDTPRRIVPPGAAPAPTAIDRSSSVVWRRGPLRPTRVASRGRREGDGCPSCGGSRGTTPCSRGRAVRSRTSGPASRDAPFEDLLERLPADRVRWRSRPRSRGGRRGRRGHDLALQRRRLQADLQLVGLQVQRDVATAAQHLGERPHRGDAGREAPSVGEDARPWRSTASSVSATTSVGRISPMASGSSRGPARSMNPVFVYSASSSTDDRLVLLDGEREERPRLSLTRMTRRARRRVDRPSRRNDVMPAALGGAWRAAGTRPSRPPSTMSS